MSVRVTPLRVLGLVLLAILLLLAAWAALAWPHEQQIPSRSPADFAPTAANLARGAYLARATGIGTWSADDFWRALHNGKSRDGRLLSPAFPYTNYTRVSRPDADALYAYLQSVPAVSQPSQPHQLRFPYNTQTALAAWRLVYFKPAVFEPATAQSAQWNRGAYLVEGLGHCSACHASRNLAGASGEDLGGGLIPVLNWYAPSLTSDGEAGLGSWAVPDIVALLKTGVSQRATVFGPMAEVVGRSLQHLDGPDIAAMAVYLKSR